MLILRKLRSHLDVACFLLDLVFFVFFFFSSRRRHTRFDCDWSSDVCSSDLLAAREDAPRAAELRGRARGPHRERSEEHTSELQSQSNLVCRLLLEKKKKNKRDRKRE